MTNDTNKNDGLTAPRPEKNGTEPLDLEKEREELGGLHVRFKENPVDQMWLDWTEERLESYLREIERLREEVRDRNSQIGLLFDAIKHRDNPHQTWLKNAIEEHFNRPAQSPTIPRCGSCDYLDKDKKFFQRLRANQKQLFYCTMNKTYWPLNGFCHNHPDWKEEG